MRLLLRIAAGFAALVLVLMAGAAAAIFLLDWNLAREHAERFAGAAVGRPVAIGHLDIEPGWASRIVLEDVRIGNAEWAVSEHLATAREVRFTIDVTPLLRGKVEIGEAVLAGPSINLERDAEGRVNWDLAGPAEVAGEIAAPETRAEFPIVGRLQVDDGRFSFIDAERELDLSGKVETATGDAEGPDTLDLALEGSLQGRTLTVDLTSGSVLMLRNSEAPFPVDLRIALGKTTLGVEGTIREPVRFEGLDLALSVEGPDLAETFPLLGIPLPETPPYRLAGQLGREGDVWRFVGFEGVVGDSDLSGDLSLDHGGEKPYLEAELVSRNLDFDDLAGFIGANPDPDETASAEQRRESRAEEGDGSLFPDTPVADERLHAMNMNVRFVGRKVTAENLPVEHLDATFDLKDGRLLVSPLSLEVAGGTVSGEAALNAREAVPSADADLSFRNLDLKPFFRDTQFLQEMGGLFSGDVYLLGTGQNLDEMMRGARGEGWIGMSEGSISGLIVEAAGLDVAEALVLYVGDDARVPIRCARIDLRSDGGRVTARRAIVDTSDSVLLARGEADLGTERLDIQIEARAKDFSLIDMAAPVAVTGSFEDPEISIGGLDPLPFLELGDTEDVDCGRLLSGELDATEIDANLEN